MTSLADRLDIKVTKDFYAIRVFIDNRLHVFLRVDEFLGMHSWVKPKPSIEFVLRGNVVVTEYDDREKWLMVLTRLEAVL